MGAISRSWRNLSLGSKLTGLASLLVVLLVFILTLISIQREQTNFQQEMESQVSLLLSTLPLTMRDQLYRQELDELVDIAQVVSRDDNITLFVVYGSDGSILVDIADNPEGQSLSSLGNTLITSSPDQIYLDWQPEQLIAGRPVVLGNQVIGAVALGLSTEPLDQKIIDLTNRNILLALVTSVLGGILAFLIARQITNPLSELTNLAARMSGGDLSIQAETQRNDEIGQLSSAFNQMAQAIQRRETELRDFADQLELLVEERTAELEAEIAERTQAEATLQLANERLSIIRQVDTELTQQLDVGYVSTVALDAAIRLSAATAGFLSVTGSEDSSLRVIQAIGAYPEHFIHAPKTGIFARVIRRQEAELVPDVDASPDYHALLEKTRALMVFPLISHRRFVGILNLETHVPELFTPDIFEFLKLLTARISVAIDNAHMFEERAQLVQELEAFAHTVAHDLKNPLSGVLGYANLLLDMLGSIPEDQVRYQLEAIDRNGTKMQSIIESLLLLAGVRAAGEVKLHRLDMRRIVGEVQDRLSFMIDDYQAAITVRDNRPWPAALGYGPWVEEVWTNYLSNALKYGGKPPRVELGADFEHKGDMARFWVRDNGPGLSEDDQAKLFTPFTRVSEVEIEGHGLGLSIVRRIIEKLNGTVGVESTPGEGSTFYFTLPLDQR